MPASRITQWLSRISPFLRSASRLKPSHLVPVWPTHTSFFGGAVTDRLTLATATGLPFLSVAFHAATGVAALVAGYLAIAARKGGTWHRRAGIVFVYSMIAMGITATAISIYEGKESVAGGVVAAYLVFTAWTAVRPLPRAGRKVDIALAVMALTLAVFGYINAFAALDRPGHRIEGVPAGMLFFLNTVFMLAAIGDARMILAGGVQGTRRLARHLWRMNFGLFIASGSFVAQLVKMTFMPDWTRSLPVILALSVAPFVVLLYWMWRVRFRQNLRGLTTAKPIEARRAA
jgi:uncharacterized membrane protein